MDESIPKWCKASVYKKFKDDLSASMTVIYKDEEHFGTEALPKLELNVRLASLSLDDLLSSRGTIQIDCLLTCSKVQANALAIDKLIGKVFKSYAACIPVHRHGTEVGDDGSYLGSLQLRTQVDSSQIGNGDPSNSLRLTLFVARYLLAM